MQGEQKLSILHNGLQSNVGDLWRGVSLAHRLRYVMDENESADWNGSELRPKRQTNGTTSEFMDELAQDIAEPPARVSPIGMQLKKMMMEMKQLSEPATKMIVSTEPALIPMALRTTKSPTIAHSLDAPSQQSANPSTALHFTPQDSGYTVAGPAPTVVTPIPPAKLVTSEFHKLEKGLIAFYMKALFCRTNNASNIVLTTSRRVTSMHMSSGACWTARCTGAARSRRQRWPAWPRWTARCRC